MLAEKKTCVFLCVCSLVLLTALPAVAGDAAPPTATIQAAAPIAGCAAGQPELSLASPGLTLPAWLDQASANLTPGRAVAGRKFRGFCPCGCSFVPDCNTSADCFGGAICQTAPSCC